MLISFVVTAKLICVFVFAYAKSLFSHDAAQIIISKPWRKANFLDRGRNDKNINDDDIIVSLLLNMPVNSYSHVG